MMTFSIILFAISVVLLSWFLAVEAVAEKRAVANQFLAKISLKCDPIIGRLLFARRKIVSEIGHGGLRLMISHIGISAAKGLFFLKNVFAKAAARLHHISKKVGTTGKAGLSGEPSFLLKAIMETKAKK